MNNRKNRFNSPSFANGYKMGKRYALIGKDLPDLLEYDAYQTASQKKTIQENNRKRPRDGDIDQEENERKYLKDDNGNRVPMPSTPLDLPQPTLPQWQGSTHFASSNHSPPALDKSPQLSPPSLDMNEDDWVLGENLLFDDVSDFKFEF